MTGLTAAAIFMVLLRGRQEAEKSGGQLGTEVLRERRL